jgi:Rha family phage regulatory protein
VSDEFKRRHDHVLRDIRETIEKVKQSEERTGNISLSKSGLPDFIKSTYIDSRDKEYPEYLLTKDGFTLLVMGFGGR